MPKDIVHWVIAERTAQKLSQSGFRDPLEQNMNACLLGAIFHDILFYLPGEKTGYRLAHILHGADGEDTFRLLRHQAKYAREGRGPAAALRRAALVGLAAHASADSIFHPMVIYFTGHGGDKAMQRHRALESTMDMALGGGLAGVRKRSLPAIVKKNMRFIGARSRRDMLGTAFAMKGLADIVSAGEEQVLDSCDKGLGRYLLLQRLYRLPLLTGALHALLPLLPEGIRPLEALFYAPQRQKTLPRLREPLVFKQPVTGEDFHETLDSMVDKAVDRAVELCLRLEPAVFGSEAPLPEHGFSLETGLPGAGMDRMSHFGPAGWIE